MMSTEVKEGGFGVVRRGYFTTYIYWVVENGFI